MIQTDKILWEGEGPYSKLSIRPIRSSCTLLLYKTGDTVAETFTIPFDILRKVALGTAGHHVSGPAVLLLARHDQVIALTISEGKNSDLKFEIELSTFVHCLAEAADEFRKASRIVA